MFRKMVCSDSNRTKNLVKNKIFIKDMYSLSQIVDKLSRNVDNLPYPKPICPEILIKCPIMLIKCPERMIKTLPLFIV